MIKKFLAGMTLLGIVATSFLPTNAASIGLPTYYSDMWGICPTTSQWQVIGCMNSSIASYCTPQICGDEQ